jgi:hypothetical protein
VNELEGVKDLFITFSSVWSSKCAVDKEGEGDGDGWHTLAKHHQRDSHQDIANRGRDQVHSQSYGEAGCTTHHGIDLCVIVWTSLSLTMVKHRTVVCLVGRW